MLTVIDEFTRRCISIPRTSRGRAVTCSHTVELIVVVGAGTGFAGRVFVQSSAEVSESKPHSPVILLAMLQDEAGDLPADAELIVGSHTAATEVRSQFNIRREVAGGG